MCRIWSNLHGKPSRIGAFLEHVARVLRDHGALLAVFTFCFGPQLALAAEAPAMITAGQPNVSDTGGFTYTMPIAAPPGTGGMAPALTLAYSSQAGDGVEGIGWSLSGLPSIGHCATTIAQDGSHGAVNYDAGDRYCINGQRLIPIGDVTDSSCPSGMEYRTEIEAFSRVWGCGVAGNAPAFFKVWTSSGQIMEFGNTLDLKVLLVKADQSGTLPTIRVWVLNKVSDTVGNYLTVTYNCAPIVSSKCTDVDRTVNGEFLPLADGLYGKRRSETHAT